MTRSEAYLAADPIYRRARETGARDRRIPLEPAPAPRRHLTPLSLACAMALAVPAWWVILPALRLVFLL